MAYHPTELFCGIDGGGTTTKGVVATRYGEVVYRFQTGTTNHYGASIDVVKANYAAIAQGLQDNLGGLPGIIFNGNAALDGLADPIQVQALTQGIFEPAQVIFHSDVYIALFGFTLGEPGAILIAGTGSMACGLDATGTYYTAGGWGQLLGDEGSAYHLALEGIKAGLRAYDGVGESTQLTSSILQHFGLRQLSSLIDLVYNPPLEKSKIAAFAPVVEAAARAGDRVALHLLDQEAEWLYQLGLAICQKCQTTKLGYFGGVLQHNDRIRTQLATRLQTQAIALQRPRFSPVIGALLAAFRVGGISLSETMLSNLLDHQSM